MDLSIHHKHKMDTHKGSADSTSTMMLASLNVTGFYTAPTRFNVTNGLINETDNKGHASEEADYQKMIIIAVMMAFTLIGNITLMLVIGCKRSRRIKRVNVLLLNLALGDLFVAMFVQSTEILFIAFGDWALGPVFCKISVYVQMICLSSATNLLTAMSIDRYQVIVKPMQSLAKRPRIWLKIAIAWSLSLLFPLPQLFIFLQYNKGFKKDGTPRRFCGSEGYTAAWQRKVYFTYTTVYILIIPMIIMLYCYAKIIRVVWIRASTETRRRSSCITTSSISDTGRTLQTRPSFSSETTGDRCLVNENSDAGCGCDGAVKIKKRNMTSVRWARTVPGGKDSVRSSSQKDKKLRFQDFPDEDRNLGSPRMSVRRSLVTASKRRVLIMTLTVVVSFLVCQTPYFVISLVRIYSDYKLSLDGARFVIQFLVMMHSTLNPVLYGLFTLRQHHVERILLVLPCSTRVVPPQGPRLRQYSGEKHRLLTCVRSKLVNKGGSTSTTTFVNNSSNRHTDPLLGHKMAKDNPRSELKESSATSPLTTSNLPKLRRKPNHEIALNEKQKRQFSDAILFTNTNVVHLKSQDKDLSESDPSFFHSSDLLPQCTLIANSHVLKTSDSPKLLHNSCRTEVRLRRPSGSDAVVTSGFPEVRHDILRHVSVMPLSCKDDASKAGGLTRV